MKNALPYICLAMAVIALFVSIISPSKDETKIVLKSDTVYYTKVDTIREIKPKYITSTVVDTVVITVKKDSVVYLPIKRTHYSKADRYDLWVSGYEAKLDSINVYDKIKYQTITNSEYKTVYKNRLSIYGSVGVYKLNNEIVPTFDITLNTPRKISLGASVGLYENKPIYGLKIGYKLK